MCYCFGVVFCECGVAVKRVYRIKFKISKCRKDRYKRVQKPIERSRYAKELFKIGGGWNE